MLETSPSCSPLLALSLCAVISEAGIYLFFVYIHLSLMVVLRLKTTLFIPLMEGLVADIFHAMAFLLAARSIL